jgi:DNA-binding beta-propeller fold protein YncE
MVSTRFYWRRFLVVAAAVVVAAAALPDAPGQERNMADSPFKQRQRVPPLPESLTWLNAAGPIELDDLRGKFVLLDFWTYCCINCMHILPELAKLEQAYDASLVVIGVHSAKFETERDAANITEAILRYDIRHPVINDANHAVWEAFGVNAWPTLILIDPEGYAVWGTSGEVTFDQLDAVLKPAVAWYRKRGLLDETPLRFDLAAHQSEVTPLRFPGKLLADAASDRLFVADSSHHRVVVAKLDGTLVDTIGSGRAGRADGDFASAEFNDPQGMALMGNALYVADNRNHLIRKIDLANRKVSTVAGTGKQRRELPIPRRGNPRNTAIASPWDLLVFGNDLYIAMAGPHQIWRMELDGSSIGPYAGNGREDIVDGPLLGKMPYESGISSFAQPSGLATDGTWIYVADSEGSSIRAVPLDPRGEVRTVVGTSKLPYARLFTFGDVDGPREQVRLQHALGVVYDAGKLYVADTYNNKIKIVNAESGETRTLAGTGKPGRADDPAEFDEPAGLSLAAGRLYVADTNNHLVRVVHLDEGNRVSTLEIAGLKPPQPPAEKESFAFPGAVQEKVSAAAVKPEAGQIRLRVRLALPADHKMNRDAPMAYQVAAEPAEAVRIPGEGRRVRVETPAEELEIALPIETIGAAKCTVRVGLDYYYCREGAEALCKRGSVVWTIPLEIKADASSSLVELRHEVR